MDENEEMRTENVEDGRNFDNEVAVLLTAFPSVRGESLPDEVVDESLRDGIPLAQAYAGYLGRQKDAELESLRHEKEELLRRDRAPVHPVSRGAPVHNRDSDPFLAGLMGY